MTRVKYQLRTLAVLLPLSFFGLAGCTDDGSQGNDPGQAAGTSIPLELYRAPVIPNVVDGVVWEAGNWEPHLAAGEEGVSWGNHRAVVVVEGAEPTPPAGGQPTTEAEMASRAEAVLVTIPWRRRDADPGGKGVIVVDATTGEAVPNALAIRIDNASGDVVFQPNPGSSEYHVYYLPWQSSGGYYPTISYPTPAELRAAGSASAAVALGGAVDNPSRAEQAGGEQGGVLLAVPVPEADAIPTKDIQNAIDTALARARNIHGAAITPFVLEQIAKITAGRSIPTNLALAENNASVAAQVAVELARLG